MDRDLYICPGGKALKTSGTVHDGNTINYIAKRIDCTQCPLKAKCTTGRERRVSRDANQEARDYYTQVLMETETYAASSGERKRIERLFDEAKNILSMVRLGQRNLSGVHDQFLLTATTQNKKRLANHSTKPPPQR